MEMNLQFDIWEKTRRNFIKLINSVDGQKINEIANGFRNNIGWNFAHSLATQQHFFYKLSNLKPVLPQFYMEHYIKGTRPQEILSNHQINELKELALTTIDMAKRDFENGKFNTFQKYVTGYGVELKTIEDAISFNPIHESMHLGYALAQKRALLNEE